MADVLDAVEAGPAIDPARRAEIEQLVGRNLLAYQSIENALKRLLLGALIEGTPADRAQRLAARAAKVTRMNLGDVSKAVFDEVLTAAPRDRPAPADASQAWVSIRFTIAPPPDRLDAFEPLRARCKAIVDHRNDLVHHFLRQYAGASDTELGAAREALDAQHGAAAVFLDEVVALIRALDEQREGIAGTLQSLEFRDQLKDAIAQGEAIDVLIDVADGDIRADGWAFLTTALHRLRERAPHAVRRLEARLGKEWLFKTMAVAPEHFEARTEPLPNGPAGATRVVYRVLPEEPAADKL